MATRAHTTISLSRLTRDPVLRAFFDRSGPDAAAPLAAPAPRKPTPPAAAEARALELA